MRKSGYAAWKEWEAARRPTAAPPVVGLEADDAEQDEPVALCHACGAQLSASVCEECGVPQTSSWGVALQLAAMWPGAVVILVFLPISIALYLLSPEGQGQLPFIGALTVGPFVAAGLAWYLYRRWYRRRYPDE